MWGDAVEEIDWSTGVILQTLRELKIEDNTFVIFTSDNGGATRHGSHNEPLKGGKGTTFEGGQRVCNVMWPGKSCGASSLGANHFYGHTTDLRFVSRHPNSKSCHHDGKNIEDVIFGKPNASSPHEAFFYFFRETLECVRSGRWKLRVANVRGDQSVQLPQLFDLDNDLSEQRMCRTITRSRCKINRSS